MEIGKIQGKLKTSDDLDVFRLGVLIVKNRSCFSKHCSPVLSEKRSKRPAAAAVFPRSSDFKRRQFNGHRSGTPDILAVFPDGAVG
jgi:hypothetical protein